MKKGIVLNLISRSLFVIGSYLIHTFLARLLGPSDYGIFGICLSILTLAYILLNNGVRQGISILISRDPSSSMYIMKRGLIIQLALAFVLGIIISLSAPLFAKILDDSDLFLPIALCGLIVFFQSIYFIYIGTLNGMKDFVKENILLSTYAISRTVFTLALTLIGFRIFGALCGFLLASIVSFVLGFLLTRKLNNKNKKFDTKSLLSISVPTILIFGTITFIMNLDVFSVKLFLKNNNLVGFYTSAQAIANLPYWFLFAFGSVVLPYISGAVKNVSTVKLKKYIEKVISTSILVSLPGVVLISSYSSDLISLIYGNDYKDASQILEILIFGLFNLGFISILAHIMLGISKERKMLTFAVMGIALNIVLSIILVPTLKTQGAAWNTFFSSFFLIILTLAFLLKHKYLKIDFLKLSISILFFLILFVTSRFISNHNIQFYIGIPLPYISCLGFFFLSGIIQKEELISLFKNHEFKNLLKRVFTKNPKLQAG